MEYDNENQLKQKLGIDSWRNLSRDKFLEFASDLPNMSKDVALKVVGQFPDFRSLVLDSLTEVQEQATNAIEVNWKSQKKVHKAFSEYRKMLSRELDREEVTAEHRLTILRMLQEAIDKESAKDSEHKVFVFKVVSTVGTIAVLGLASALALLGVKTNISGSSST